MAERKYNDYFFEFGPTVAQQITAVASLLPLSQVSQGTSNFERIGDKTTGTSLQLCMDIFSPGLVTSAVYNTTRCIIFIWIDDDIPTPAEILESTANPILTALAFDYKVKRKILYDKVLTQFYAPATAAVENIRLHTKAVINLSKIKGGKNIQHFSTIGEVNGIWLLLVNENAGAVNTQWQYNVYTRYTFQDL